MTDSHLALTKANIVSVYQAGAFFGSLSAYVSAYFLGRKRSLWVYSIVFILGAGMMLGANGQRGLGLIVGGRVLAGIGVGGCSMVVPIYISEISPPAIRGALVGIYELGWQMGGLVGFWVSCACCSKHAEHAQSHLESNVLVKPCLITTNIGQDQLRPQRDNGSQSQAVDHSIRCPAYTCRLALDWLVLAPRITTLAYVKRQKRQGTSKSLLDSPLACRRHLHGRRGRVPGCCT